MAGILEFLKSGNIVIYITAALAISEALAFIPFIKSNSIVQAIVNGLKWIKDTFYSKPPEA